MTNKTFLEMKQELDLLFENKISKFLPQYEKERKAHAIVHVIINILFTEIILLIIFAVATKFAEEIFLPILGGVILSMLTTLAIWVILRKILNLDSYTIRLDIDFDTRIKNEFKNEIIQVFMQNGIFEKNSISDYKRREKLQKQLKRTKIFNFIPFLIIDDCITGTYNNVKIRIYELSTKQTKYNNIVASVLFCIFLLLMVLSSLPIIIFLIFCLPVGIILFFLFLGKIIQKIYEYSPFRGLVIKLNFEKELNQETFFLEKSFSSLRIPFDKNRYKEVIIESVEFTKNFRIYSDNQIESRTIFTPDFIDKINKIREIYKTCKIRGHFKKNQLILTINTNKDMFAFGNDFKKTSYKTFEIFYNEMISIFKLIDELKNYLN